MSILTLFSYYNSPLIINNQSQSLGSEMRKSAIVLLLVSILFTLSFNGCDSDDGVSSGSLVGNYILAYYLEKSSNTTFYAGQATTYMGGSMTISATLSLTESTYNMTMTVSTTFYGQTYTSTTADAGTYTTSGNTFTTSATDGEDFTMNYTFNGSELTMEDDETKLVFNRQ